MQNVAYSVKSA